ncbi:hypothetical protein F5Y17DRAFT_449220 [Xylariaceae sp. FL0594]|nr:hypothetical protein F5Y17DRAFT_449220 [Xylariaceae sp. FL0594]
MFLVLVDGSIRFVASVSPPHLIALPISWRHLVWFLIFLDVACGNSRRGSLFWYAYRNALIVVPSNLSCHDAAPSEFSAAHPRDPLCHILICVESLAVTVDGVDRWLPEVKTKPLDMQVAVDREALRGTTGRDRAEEVLMSWK